VRLTYAELSHTGVRAHNEDFVQFWQSEAEQEHNARGAIALLADGVGGHGDGEVASRLAVTTALDVFRKADTGLTSNQLLWRLFNEANLAVYDAGMPAATPTRMATTLTIALFRYNEVAIGHVGDSRAYLVRQGQIQQLTADHTYLAMQLKMNLVSQAEAAASEMRGMLTRSIGENPTVQVDYNRVILRNHDTVILCSDGLHACLAEHELRDCVNRLPPDAAADHLVRLAEKRGSQDNISVQIIRVEDVARIAYYRGSVAYSVPATAATASTHELQPGSLLDERFQITDVISRSAMSSVFKATDLKTGRPVALKVPLPSLEGDVAAFSRFQREEEIGRALDHPTILKIIRVEDSEKSRPYIVMELLEGQTLERLMRQIRPLPESDALAIVSQVCDGLQYLHSQGVVHRDLKPQNIMLCSDGSLRIMDFGIAKVASSRRMTFGGFSPTMGTPDYMAPEQVKGQRGDERTDIYSLGAILYEMLTGRVPFEGQNAYMIMNARLLGDPVAPRVRNPAIRPEVEEIVLHAMARDPDDRYPSAAAMKADLEAPEQVAITGRAERLQAPTPWKSRWRNVRVVAISILVPIILFYLFFLMFSRR
jgi:serine/threonine protein phosphatase PrpC